MSSKSINPSSGSTPTPAREDHNPALIGAHRTEEGHTGAIILESAEAPAKRAHAAGALGLLAVLFGGYWVVKDILTPVHAQAPTQSTPVQVKVTRGMQPISGGHSLRIEQGPSYAINCDGETIIDPQWRGSRYELKAVDGTVVRKGVVPDGTARLDIDLQ